MGKKVWIIIQLFDASLLSISWVDSYTWKDVPAMGGAVEVILVIIQLPSSVRLSVTPWTVVHQASLCTSLPFWELMLDREAWRAAVHGSQRVGHDWATELNWTEASLSFISSLSLLKLMSTESVMPSNYHILCLPLLLPSIFPTIRVFSNELALCIRWPKYWQFSYSISPSNEYSGLISFRIDWFDLLEVQGTLKSLRQLHNSKASILQHSAFYMV